MIISPSIDNFATMTPASAYTVDLPDISLNLEAGKTVSTSKVIGGGSAISIWESSIEGEQVQFQITVEKEKYLILKKIKATGIDSWLWRVQGRIFEVVFDLAFAARLAGPVEKYQCVLILTISKEV